MCGFQVAETVEGPVFYWWWPSSLAAMHYINQCAVEKSDRIFFGHGTSDIPFDAVRSWAQSTFISRSVDIEAAELGFLYTTRSKSVARTFQIPNTSRCIPDPTSPSRPRLVPVSSPSRPRLRYFTSTTPDAKTYTKVCISHVPYIAPCACHDCDVLLFGHSKASD